jgi:hypothetical protein
MHADRARCACSRPASPPRSARGGRESPSWAERQRELAVAACDRLAARGDAELPEQRPPSPQWSHAPAATSDRRLLDRHTPRESPSPAYGWPSSFASACRPTVRSRVQRARRPFDRATPASGRCGGCLHPRRYALATRRTAGEAIGCALISAQRNSPGSGGAARGTGTRAARTRPRANFEAEACEADQLVVDHAVASSMSLRGNLRRSVAGTPRLPLAARGSSRVRPPPHRSGRPPPSDVEHLSGRRRHRASCSARAQ